MNYNVRLLILTTPRDLGKMVSSFLQPFPRYSVLLHVLLHSAYCASQFVQYVNSLLTLCTFTLHITAWVVMNKVNTINIYISYNRDLLSWVESCVE